MYIIKFSNAIAVGKEQKKGEQHICYKLGQLKRNGAFEILKNISEHDTLVQRMDALGNTNNAISVVGKWILHSNEKNLSID